MLRNLSGCPAGFDRSPIKLNPEADQGTRRKFKDSRVAG
ncbi:hypothetical protein LEP1GSC061_2445 [Leptospira wolffii serovar Khorat str. Khorat-H2]|nr:hypothetical protein LEP1GSC061_2445 [Leptospira wolffii serovar Khorat str. Khorat-H2]